MAKKIFISGKSLVIQDTVSSYIDFDFPKGNCYYVDSSLTSEEIWIKTFGNINTNNGASKEIKIALSDAVEEDGSTAYTKTTFRTFCNTYLGFTSSQEVSEKPSGTSSFTTLNPTNNVSNSAIKSTDIIVIMPTVANINEVFTISAITDGGFTLKRAAVNTTTGLTSGLTYKWKVV